MSQPITPFIHQSDLLRAPWDYLHINSHFLIGGYSSGKSSALRYSIWDIIYRYWKYPIDCTMYAPTLTFLRKTLFNDLRRDLLLSGTPFNFNGQHNILTVGNITFRMVPTENPERDIYGYNDSIAIIDELDELPLDKVLAAHTAISERNRVPLPDGRDPYMIFGSTAQGYRGLYQVIEKLKDSGIGYTHIRGRTIDNTSLKPSYYSQLYNLYTENERLAFLEGYFVNLTTGRVYPEFGDAQLLKEPIALEPNETVHVGQDLNTGFSKAVAAVIRDKSIIAVEEFSFKAIGDAPRILRNRFPTQRIIWYPDASGKEIMAGYNQEMRDFGIEIRWGSVNPPILERIFFVNKLLAMGRFKIPTTLKMLVTALRTRQYDQSGAPEKGKGESATDHIMDGCEYMVFRLVSSMPEFFDLWQLSKSYKQSRL